MKIRLRYLECLAINIVQDSGITGPVAMHIVYDSRMLCKQYKTVVKYWTLIWIINVVMQIILPDLQWLSMEIVQVSGINSAVK